MELPDLVQEEITLIFNERSSM